jgi:hypothetical protein
MLPPLGCTVAILFDRINSRSDCEFNFEADAEIYFFSLLVSCEVQIHPTNRNTFILAWVPE